ncbi:MAG: sigma-70 family RNA polymerase sigma factor [Pirellulales bacterium]|nr:sigma-70 family RNA polymerase sigma factor [Pirellulales bacterium]
MTASDSDFESDSSEQERHTEFLRLFSQHSRRVFEFISTLVFNSSDAEEVFQDTCVVLWRKFSEYDPEGSFYAWACKVAYFEILHLRRANQRLQIMSEEVLTLLADDLLCRSEHLTARRAALEECLDKLAAKDRSLIQQRYYLQHRPKEIARKEAASVHSIYRSLARIHVALRECVGRVMAKENAS